MPSTIAELASRLNLSKGAVSRILNDKGGAFSEETRRRVLTLADEIGYRPHPIARALATGQTGVASLWVHDLMTSYHAYVAHQMEDRLERHGYQIAITLYGKAAGSHRKGAASSPPIVVADGIIAHELSGDAWPLLLGSSGRLPIVTTGAWCPNETVDHVGVDLEPACMAAYRHLVASGRRRIAYLTDLLAIRPGDARYDSYRTVMEESGLSTEYIETCAPDRATVRRAARTYFQSHGCPEAIFCHNDDAAIATYRALCDLGRRVPDDVALIGCDGIEDTEYLSSPITTIVQPLGAMCEQAVAFLKQRLAEPDAPRQWTVLQPELALRDSSRF